MQTYLLVTINYYSILLYNIAIMQAVNLNAYFFHPENILLYILNDKRSEIHIKVTEKIENN